MTVHLLLLSNSTNNDSDYLAHATDEVLEFLDEAPLTFVPFALADHDAYTQRVIDALAPHGVEVTGLHTSTDPIGAVEQARAVFVGGGNTFRLLSTLERLALVAPLRERVRSGMPYMGASAGTNIAGGTIRTTNDMPIVQPSSFDALGLVPFQLNPHFIDADPHSTHRGETREQRLTEFLEENDAAVLGLREGTWLRVDDERATIGGQAVGAAAPGPAVVFERGASPHEVSGDVSALLHRQLRLDVGSSDVAPQ
ncbi:dipeptidase PepE [Brachybacterium halotolerans subsp. kimchii]|uniref:dipeptidase PepE n=1 Tax=Brachybacterium halotolerans TaxID=2795215 RepID=UPI001E300876|nr:dipeptidase PepE [Brachybacterium halotolerans]UEJ81836.1 dipeptidase PepE [Brachybacterium halotolerans subsp. kimchii]